MSTETVEAPAVVAPPQDAPEPTEAKVESTEAKPEDAKPEEPPKKEKTAEEREISRLRRRVDNLTRRLYEGQAQQGLQSKPIGDTNQVQADDSEALSLSRAELSRLIEQEARKLAPTISEQQTAIEHRRSVISRLSSELGQERFDALADDLNDAFDGLKDAQGRPKPAADAIFEAEDPRALIEYLADPDNADEAATLSRMGALQAGRALAKLESKIAAKKAEAKPEPSKAAAVIEPVKGAGAVRDNLPRDTDSVTDWVRKERARLSKTKPS